MHHRAVAAAAACLSVFLSPAAQAEDQPKCMLKRVANLDMTMDQFGRPLVPVTINGVKLHFVVDTAGIYTGVTQRTVDALKLKTERLHSSDIRHIVSGEAVTQMAFADKFMVGALPVDNMAFMVMPPSMTAEDGDGILSGEFLHLFDIELDYAAAKFSIFLQNDCGPQVVHWTHEPHGELPFVMNKVPMNTEWAIYTKNPDWHIITRAKLDGVDVDATFDTGASTSFMTVEDAEGVLPNGVDEKSLKRLDQGADPQNGTYTYPFKTLVFGDLKIDNPLIIMMHSRDGGASRRFNASPQLVLGDTILRQLHLYIAYKEKKIYFTNATAH